MSTDNSSYMWMEKMGSRMQTSILLSSFFFLSSVTVVSSANDTDTISSDQSLTWKDSLISKGGNFELGFFKPGNSSNYYIGIWYKKVSIQAKTYVWVANGNTPLTDPTSSELKLLENGNLVLLNHSNMVVWSTNSTSNTLNSSQAVLGDDGNFVITNGRTQSDVLWQSFDHQTGTFLPGGKIGYNYKTRKSQQLNSWRSANDPSQGFYSLVLDQDSVELVIRGNRNNASYWSSGGWNGKDFSNIPEMTLNYFNFSYVKNENESYYTYNIYNAYIISRVVLDEWGQIQALTWDDPSQQWFLLWSQPRQRCSVYGYCGFFSVCDNGNCKCMDGFIPQSLQDSNISGYFSGNCVKETLPRCGKSDTFTLVQKVGLPKSQIALKVSSANDCRFACLNRCPCTAYNYSTACSIWTENLQVTEGDEVLHDIYVRFAAPKDKGKTNIGVIVGAVASVLVLGLVISFIYFKKRPKRKGIIIKYKDNIALRTDSQSDELESPLFDFATIATATAGFSFSNQIGQGGFGSVYKGILPSGEEIAIKRLSKDSRQGLQEFMNEVILIAKLQHRNLVRLLGCCVQGDDKMLIYEYMSNKSLDSFIFDKTRSANLNWEKRFNIIVGIARGLLYLHQDSRLKIIHRDLKASNVLLDSEMNPKISDFGMARTFGIDQSEENTKRVVGTYGYMSPEYATDGIYSMKSDIFSFGVIVLEIVSGKRNRGFYHADHDLNLLGHIWNLLKDNRALEIMDASIADSLTASEVFKCIQVGLLCVQKFPEDRPSTATVLSMLDGDGKNLPDPKEPGFYTERSPFQQYSSCSLGKACTNNVMITTLLEGR